MRTVCVVAAAAIGFVLGPVRPAMAQGAPLRAFVSNGVKTVVDEIRPQWEHAAGRPLALEFGTTAALKKRIENGEAFDVALLTSDAIGNLIQEGKVTGASRRELARAGIGIGMRAGAAKPDIHTAAALKRTLLEAKSVTFAEAGASRTYLERMFAHFGITDQMKAKMVLTPSSVKSNELVRDGKAQYILTLVSEILPAQGVQLVGPLPAEAQNYINFAAGASANSADKKADAALLQFLKSARTAAVFNSKGLEAR